MRLPSPPIRTALWFDRNAEEAMNFYVSLFDDSAVLSVLRNLDERFGAPGSLLAARFRIAGREFEVINGGPMFKLSEAVSIVVECRDQREVDHYWSALIADGGAESQCGWLRDRFGLSWQVVPGFLYEALGGSDRARAQRVFQAMLGMRKFDIAALEAAARGDDAATSP